MGTYPRDLRGYGAIVPNVSWPNGAKLALQIVLNYEEGAENCVLHGDKASETFLSEIIGAQAFEGMRHKSMESIYEYGSRSGVWRLLRIFAERDIKITVFGVAMALQRHPEVAEAILKAGHEIAGHGWRWVNYQEVDKEIEREHLNLAIETIEDITGSTLLGWYTGRDSPNTRHLLVEQGNFLYDSDSYSDDLPYWEVVNDKPHLVIPYTLDCNDMRFATPQGFNSGEQFFNYLKDSFDVLYAEGDSTPKMMSVGLHCRIIGRPGRAAALQRFLDYVQQHDDVWICRRDEIAMHWHKHYPYPYPYPYH